MGISYKEYEAEMLYIIMYENKNELDAYIKIDGTLSDFYVNYTESVVWI